MKKFLCNAHTDTNFIPFSRVRTQSSNTARNVLVKPHSTLPTYTRTHHEQGLSSCATTLMANQKYAYARTIARLAAYYKNIETSFVVEENGDRVMILLSAFYDYCARVAHRIFCVLRKFFFHCASGCICFWYVCDHRDRQAGIWLQSSIIIIQGIKCIMKQEERKKIKNSKKERNWLCEWFHFIIAAEYFNETTQSTFIKISFLFHKKKTRDRLIQVSDRTLWI